MCQSECDTCGMACPGVTVSDISTLIQYQQKRCSIIMGDLTISISDNSFSYADLVSAFGTVTKIQGDLIISGTQYLVGLNFFQQLRQVNTISILSNMALVDARMPALLLFDAVKREYNPRLCESWLPGSTVSQLSNPDCVKVSVSHYFVYNPQASPGTLGYTIDDVGRLLEADIKWTTGLTSVSIFI